MAVEGTSRKAKVGEVWVVVHRKVERMLEERDGYDFATGGGILAWEVALI